MAKFLSYSKFDVKNQKIRRYFLFFTLIIKKSETKINIKQNIIVNHQPDISRHFKLACKFLEIVQKMYKQTYLFFLKTFEKKT